MGDQEILEEVRRVNGEMRSFIEERYDPLSQSVDLLREENQRLVEEFRQVIDLQKGANRAALLRSYSNVEGNVVTQGKYRGMTQLDLSIARSVLEAAEKNPQDVNPRMLADWRVNLDAANRALDDTTANAGDELVPTLEDSELWRDVHLMTSVASLFPTIVMPSNPFEMPLDLGDINWYPGTANVASKSTDPNTDKRTLTAFELVGVVAWSYNLDEDAVIAMMPELRTLLVRNAAEVMDDVILNADTTLTNNINADGATIASADAGKGQWLLGFDGLRHIALVDNTGQGNDHNAVTDEAMYNEIRALLGKYGVRPSELAFISDIQTYILTVGITNSNVRTLDKYGPQATVLTGELGKLEGIPIIVSEQMRQTDDDGLVTDPVTDANNDNGTLMIVNRTQYRKGFRRQLMIESERDIQKRQTIMVASMRLAFDGRNANASDTSMAMQFNIT